MITKNDNSFVKCEIPTSIRVGQLLLNKGFKIANTIGEKDSLSYCDGFCVLYDDVNLVQKKYFFGLFKSQKRMINLGYLDFNKPRVFKLNGSKYIKVAEEMINFINEIVIDKFTLILINEEPRMELFPQDFWYYKI